MKYLLSLLFLFLPIPCSATAVISEVMWMGSDLSTADEWVELTCTQDCPVDLSGWVLTKGTGDTVLARFPASFTIQTGEYVVISNNPASNSRLAEEPKLVTSGISLPNTKLLLRLRDHASVLIDEVDDGVGSPFAGRNEAPKASMERMDLLQPGNIPTNWRTAQAQRGFDAGANLFGTPGYPNGSQHTSSQSSLNASSSQEQQSLPQASTEASSSTSSVSSIDASFSSSSSEQSSYSEIDHISSSYISSEGLHTSIYSSSEMRILSSENSSFFSSSMRVLITEVLSNPIGKDDGEWIEVGNLGAHSVDLTGWELRVGGTSSYIITGSASLLSPQSFILFDKQRTGMTLRNDGTQVQLLRQGTAIDEWTYPELPEGVSYGRAATTQGLQNFCTPTPRTANHNVVPGVSIAIQSGQTSGVGSLTLNLQATSTISVSLLTCSWDYEDGFTSDACNPASHTFRDIGEYSISLKATDYCGNTVERFLSVSVHAKVSGSSSITSASSIHRSSHSSSVGQPTHIPVAKELSISGVLPNPKGKDEGLEWVELFHAGNSSAVLTGWSLRLLSQGKSIGLEGSIGAQGTKRHLLSLKNAGDTLELLNPEGQVVSSVSWKDAKDDQIIRTSGSVGESRQAKVVSIVDGDTIHVSLFPGAKPLYPTQRTDRPFSVRLIGIDAPESKHPWKQFDPKSLEASESIGSLLEGKNIELQFDTNVLDVHGRVLAYVHVDGMDVGKYLVEHGWASAYLPFPFARREEYLASQEVAQKQKLGLWAEGILEAHGETGVHINVSRSTVGQILINEVYPAPKPGESEWIELFNPSFDAVFIGGWKIDDVQIGGSKPWTIPQSRIIAPLSSILLSLQESSIKLNDTGDDVVLLGPDGVLIDMVTLPKMKKGQSYSRQEVPSETGESSLNNEWCITSTPTPGTINNCTFISTSSIKTKLKSTKVIQKITSKDARIANTAVLANAHSLESSSLASLDTLYASLLEVASSRSDSINESTKSSQEWGWKNALLIVMLVFGMVSGWGIVAVLLSQLRNK